MINKNQFCITHDKKLLRKIGKQWVTVSAMTLALLGGGALATSVVTHAASTNPAVKAQSTNNVKKQLNGNLDKAYRATQSASGSSVSSSKASQSSSVSAQSGSASQPSATPQGIMKTASLVHANMLNNAQKPNTTPSSVSAESNASNQSASSASSKASSSNDAMNTFTLGTPAQQQRGWNFVQHGVKNNDFDNTKPSTTSSASSDTQSASSSASASSVAPSNSVSASAKPSFNSAYKSYMAQMSGTDSEVASANAGNVQSDNKNAKKPLLKDNAQPDYFSGRVTKTGTDDGLNYKVWSNGGVEFTDGTAKSDLSNFSVNLTTYTRVSDVDTAKAIKFDNGIDTSKVTNMEAMFDENNSLQSLILPSSFNTDKVTNMNYMFQGDISLRSLTLPSSFDTSNVTTMSGMFNDDSTLQSLTLPSSFDTSNVKTMSDIFLGMKGTITLSSDFDIRKIYNRQYDAGEGAFDAQNQMFGSAIENLTNISSLTIKSPNTIFDSQAGLPQKMYKKDDKDNYTSTTPVNLMDGKSHVGIWLATPNPVPATIDATIQYQKGDKNVGNAITLPKQSFGKTISISSLNNVPNGYQLSNPAQQITYNGNTYDVPVDVKDDTDTVAFYAKHGNDNVLVSKATVSGTDGSSVNISKDVPSNYQLANGNPNVTLTANTTDDIELTLKNGQSINNPYIPEKVTPDSANADVQYQYNNQTVNSDSTDYQGNNYQATDAGNNGTTISDNNEKGLPQGWHLANKDTSISYDNGKPPVAIDPNHISDNVIYQYNGQNVNNGYRLGSHSFGGNDYRATQAGNNGIDIKQANATGLRDGYTLVNADNNIQFDSKTKYIPVKPNQISDKGTLTLNYVESNGRTDKTVTLHPAIKGNVDDTLTLAKPLDYAEDNYTVPSSDFTWTIKPNNNEPSKTFTYNAPTAGNVTIQYYDTATGNHLTQFDKTLTASDMERAPYNLNWIVGNTIKLGIKGANDNAIDVLQAPSGYHFAKNYPAESVTLPEAQSGNRQGLTLHVGLMLMARPVTPKKPNKHNSGKVTPVKPNKPASSGNVTPIQPSSASVTPISSASVAPSSVSVAPSSKANPASSTPFSASSVAPSSSTTPASQSVAPIVTLSSKASSASVSAKPNVVPKFKTTVPSHIAKPIAHHHSHKNTNGNAHLAHLVHEATAKLSTVKSNVAKRNVLKGQLNDSKLTTHAKATANEPTMGKSVFTNASASATNTSVAPSSVATKSVTEPSNAPKNHVATQSTATTYTNRKKLPQTGETNAHTGVVALIAMAAGAILAGFGKVFDRKHNE